MELSVENLLFFSWIKGINASKLISKPNHIPSQELDEIEISEPIIKTKKKKNL